MCVVYGLVGLAPSCLFRSRGDFLCGVQKSRSTKPFPGVGD